MKRRFHLSFLLLAGILMLGAGLIGLTTVPDLMQYAFIPQAETDALTQAPYQAETEALTPEPSDEDADSVSRPATEIKTVMLDKYDKENDIEDYIKKASKNMKYRPRIYSEKRLRQI